LIHRCWCGSCAQENLQKPWESDLPLKTAFLWSGLSGSMSGMSGHMIRSIWTVTRSLRVTVTHPKFLWDRNLRTPMSYPGTLHPTASFLWEGGINTPLPLHFSLLLIWNWTRQQAKGELSHFPSFILE
jgi:hypothetical protein